MKQLPKTWRRKGADYEVIKRDGDAVMVQLRREGRTFYEVAHVQRHDGYAIAGKVMDAAEHMPSSESWGQLAWSYSDIESATARFESLRSGKGVLIAKP